MSDSRVEIVAMAWLDAMRPSLDKELLHSDPRHEIVLAEAEMLAQGFLAMFDAAHICCGVAAVAPVVAVAEVPAAVPEAANKPEPVVVEAAPTVDPAETGSAEAVMEAPAAATEEHE